MHLKVPTEKLLAKFMFCLNSNLVKKYNKKA